MYNVGSAVCALTMLLLKSFLQDPRESYTISPHKPLGENLQYWLHTVTTHVQDNQNDFEAPTARPSAEKHKQPYKRKCEHKQTKSGIQLGGITSSKLNAELHKSP